MKAYEVIKILQQNPNADVFLRYDTTVVYSECTSGTEDVVVPLDEAAISNDDDRERITFCADLCQSN